MLYVVLTVFSYLLFNIAIWLSLGTDGLYGMAAANMLGAVATAWWFRVELKGTVRFGAAALGGIGILIIVLGLRYAHSVLPVAISMEMVYNGFAVTSWPLFVVLGFLRPGVFKDRPGWFDLFCHALMALLVAIRIMTCGVPLQIIIATWFPVLMAVVGYAFFNVSVKIAGGHRPTNITMNLTGSLFLALSGLLLEGLPSSYAVSGWHLLGAIVGGGAIFGIVLFLGKSYKHFAEKSRSSLVAPLVYDGVLVASPLVTFFVGGEFQVAAIAVAFGMLVVTALRYRWHQKYN